MFNCYNSIMVVETLTGSNQTIIIIETISSPQKNTTKWHIELTIWQQQQQQPPHLPLMMAKIINIVRVCGY